MEKFNGTLSNNVHLHWGDSLTLGLYFLVVVCVGIWVCYFIYLLFTFVFFPPTIQQDQIKTYREPKHSKSYDAP